MTKHTDGPWKVELLDEHRRNPIRVVDADDNDIAVLAYGGDVGREEAEANACLMASAPDLLAALKALLEKHFAPPWVEAPLQQMPRPEVIAARAAIAKAEAR